MNYKQREVESFLFYGRTIDEAHEKFTTFCADRHVLDISSGCTKDGRCYFQAIVERIINNKKQLNEAL